MASLSKQEGLRRATLASGFAVLCYVALVLAIGGGLLDEAQLIALVAVAAIAGVLNNLIRRRKAS